MIERVFGTKTFKFNTLRVSTDKVVLNGEQHQARINDDLAKRLCEIERSMLEEGSTNFYDNIVTYKRGNEFVDIDGYRRLAYAKAHEWPFIDIDVLVNPTPKNIQYIVDTCNIVPGVRASLTWQEKAAICYRRKEAKESYASIGEMLHIAPGTAKDYAYKHAKWLKKDSQHANILGFEMFADSKEAVKKTVQFVAEIFRQTAEIKGLTDKAAWAYLRKFGLETWGVYIVYSRGDDNEIKSLEYEYHVNSDNQILFRALAFIYTTRQKDTTTPTQTSCAKYSQWYPNNFLAIQMNANIEHMDRQEISAYLVNKSLTIPKLGKINLTSSKSVV